MTLPTKALSIRQPWAWAILYAGKDVENRSWQAVNHGLNQRGPVAIHASATMAKGEYESARDFMASIGVTCPDPHELRRGGIVGEVEIVDVVKHNDSPWFFGPRGLILANPSPCTLIPVKGCLGFFNWRNHLTDEVPEPARWMLPKEERAVRGEDKQGRLL